MRDISASLIQKALLDPDQSVRTTARRDITSVQLPPYHALKGASIQDGHLCLDVAFRSAENVGHRPICPVPDLYDDAPVDTSASYTTWRISK